MGRIIFLSIKIFHLVLSAINSTHIDCGLSFLNFLFYPLAHIMVNTQQESWQWAAGLLRASSHLQWLLRGTPSPRRHVLRGVFPQGRFPEREQGLDHSSHSFTHLVTDNIFFVSVARLSKAQSAFIKSTSFLFWASFSCLWSPLVFTALKHMLSFSPKFASFSDFLLTSFEVSVKALHFFVACLK